MAASIHMVQTLLNGILGGKFIILRISKGIPLGPVPLCLFRSATRGKISFGVQDSKTKACGLGFPNYLSKDFKIGVLFFSRILSATVEK